MNSAIFGYLFLKDREKAIVLGWGQPGTVLAEYRRAVNENDPLFTVCDRDGATHQIATDQFVEIKNI